MLLLESLPTVIGAAAIAPALLVLWLVIAADERPGPPAQVWIAFLLISFLLGGWAVRRQRPTRMVVILAMSVVVAVALRTTRFV